MEKARVGAILIISFIFLMVTCALAAAPPTGSPVKNTPAISSAKPSFQQTWQDWLSAAKREGILRLYGTLAPQISAAFGEKFKEKFGIPIEYVIGRGTEVAEKVKRERSAGLYR